jgi:hypothetical protein
MFMASGAQIQSTRDLLTAAKTGKSALGSPWRKMSIDIARTL